jgi:hypothetical protein
MIRPAVLLALAVAAAPAFAELYRYRDPETGQMKLTNVPPPWMKKHPQAVQVIQMPGTAQSPAPALQAPAGTPARDQALAPQAETSTTGAPAASGSTLPPNAFEMDGQRQLLLQQLVVDASDVGTPSGRERFLLRLGSVISLEARLETIDPPGRKVREAERDRALDQCSDGFAQALKDPNAEREFTGEMLRFMGERVVQCARGPC